MTQLAIDSSGKIASAAILEDSRLVADITLNSNMQHSRMLMPAIDRLLALADMDKGRLDFIAVSAGPGSFTGLRIGAAAAKGLAFGLGIKLIPIPTLDALAYNIPFGNAAAIMDARRGQVYAAIYKDGARQSDYMACPIEELLDITPADCTFTGDGLDVFADMLLSRGFKLAPLGHNLQRAVSVGALALTRVNQAVDPSGFALSYIRASQAERERG